VASPNDGAYPLARHVIVCYGVLNFSEGGGCAKGRFGSRFSGGDREEGLKGGMTVVALIGESKAAAFDDCYRFGPFSLYIASRSLEREGQRLTIGDRHFDVLRRLVTNAGQIVSKEDLLATAWPGIHVQEGALRVCIAALRDLLRDDLDGVQYVKNVRGRGYLFVAPVMSRPAAPSHTATSSENRFPQPSSSRRMIGRTEALAEVDALLRTQRLVTIVGPGGIGKTTLARAVALGLLQDNGIETCFVDLSVLTDADALPNLIAVTLGVQLEGDAFASLSSAFRNRAMLLVLDCCEHVVSEAARFAEALILQAPAMMVLGTSREPLRISGEQVVRLPSLSVPPAGSILSAEDALQYPSVQLLIERARSGRHDLVFTDVDVALAVEICRRLDGIALAIELAGAKIAAVGIGETLALLDSQSGLRWLGNRTALPRHQTLQATLEWSYLLLSDVEQRLLEHLSVLVGDFSMSMALKIASGASGSAELLSEALAGLVAKSLVSADFGRDEDRYRLLDITKTFAKAKLEQSGQQGAVLKRLGIALLDWIAQPAGDSASYIDERALTAVRRQIRNLRVVIPWCFSSTGDPCLGAQLTAAAAPALLELSFWSECARWSEAAVALHDVFDGLEPDKQLELLTSYAQGCLLLDRQEPSVHATLLRALDLAQNLDERQLELRVLLGLHRYLSRNEDFSGSLDVAIRMKEVAIISGNTEMVLTSDLAIGISYTFLGVQSKACDFMADALRQIQSMGRTTSTLFAHNTDFHATVCLARALWLRGSPNQAIATAQRAVQIAETKKAMGTFGLSAVWAIQVFFWTGDLSGAQALADGLLEGTEGYAATWLRKFGAALRGELLVRRGDTEAGLPLLESYLDLLIASGRYSLMPTLAFVEGLIAEGKLDRANETLQGAISNSERHSYLLYMPEMLRLRGEILFARNEDGAEASFRQALTLAQEQSALSWTLRIAMSLFRFQRKTGCAEDYEALLRSVYGQFVEGFDTQDLRAAAAALELSKVC